MTSLWLIAILLTAAIVSGLFPSTAEANVGVPMIFLTYPAMLLALLPAIGVETAVFERTLRLGVRTTGWRVAVANTVSTVAGFPLTWLVGAAVQMGVGFGLERLSLSLYWMVLTAAIVGLVLALFVSVWIEGHILKRMLKTTDTALVWALTWKANLITYALLTGIAGVWLLYSFATR